MAHFTTLVAACLLALAGTAHAGYAQMTPPAGWAAAAESGARATFRAAANESWVGNTVRTTASLNVGGRAVAMPAAMRMAANAPLFAARAAVGLNPIGLGITLGAALAIPAMQAWMNQAGVSTLPDGSRWYGTSSTYRASGAHQCQGGDIIAVGKCGVAAVNSANPNDFSGGEVINVVGTSFLLRFTYIPSGGSITQSVEKLPDVETVEITKADAAQRLAANPLPNGLPDALKMPLPVEDPIINPNPALQPQPMRVPQGNPQPVPDTDPQQYRQPMTRVTPAPSPASPWQVDLTPEDVVSTDPDGIKDPTPVEETDPSGQPKEPDLCEKNPDILACQKPNLDTPEAPALETKEVPITVTPDSGWGSSTAQCPAPRYIHPQGRQIAIPFDLFCTYMAGMRPIIIAMAWIMAAFIVVGYKGD